ncbi:glutamate racemase [Candidatus Uhrbacteria bacterium]|nr:glutamate racemase [Candidatus Uhrbacteria bacterium]
MSIGIFDSGLGGLTVLKQIVKLLPQYEYVYFGDNAHAPYGDRSEERIYEFTKNGVDFLFRQGCILVILACNTATAVALRRLQQEWLPTAYPDRRILGIVLPVVESVVTMKVKRPKRIGVIGSRATVQSNAYGKEIAKRDPALVQVLFQKSCPLLVPFIEEGMQKSIPATMILKHYLRPLKQKQISILILGCTHYPMMKKKIQSVMGRSIVIVDPAIIAARSLKLYFERHPEIVARLAQHSDADEYTARVRFFTTDIAEKIKSSVARFWGRRADVQRIALE